MDLSDHDRDLLLAGLVALAVNREADDTTRQHCRSLASRLGGDFDALLATETSRAAIDALEQLPELADDPDGTYYPHATHVADDALAASTLARLFADCIANGRHHLATLDHPEEGMVIGCTHCHRYWHTRDPA